MTCEPAFPNLGMYSTIDLNRIVHKSEKMTVTFKTSKRIVKLCFSILWNIWKNWASSVFSDTESLWSGKKSDLNEMYGMTLFKKYV